jgi:hypothetical protein
MVYFLSEIYRSTRESGGKKPDNFVAAYLLHKYRSEFAMPGIPGFVRRAIFPILRIIGQVSGKYRRFAHGPEPVR